MGCNQDNYLPCSKGCKKTTRCTCKCSDKYLEEKCNDCVNQDGITFDGICKAKNFLQIGEDMWKQLTVVGTVEVPKEKPSIEDVDKISVDVQILSENLIKTPVSNGPNYEGKKVTGNKLIIEGLICLKVSYVALVPEQSVHSFHGAIPFSAFIVLEGGDIPPCDYLVQACVEEICVNRICERNIEATIALFLKAKPVPTLCPDGVMNVIMDDSGIFCRGLDRCPVDECFTDSPDIKGVCDEKEVMHLLGDYDKEWTEVSIPELLTIPELKPDLYQIASVNSRVEIMCQEVIKTPRAWWNAEGNKLTGYKLLVHALLRQRITYISTKDCGSVHSAHYDVPITVYIVLSPYTNLTEKYRIKACIEDLYACPLNERQIFKNTTLFVKATPIEECPYTK